MADEGSGESITRYLANLVLFGGSWVIASGFVKTFESSLGLYTWFLATTLVAFIVTFGAFVLYYRLESTLGTGRIGSG